MPNGGFELGCLGLNIIYFMRFTYQELECILEKPEGNHTVPTSISNQSNTLEQFSMVLNKTEAKRPVARVQKSAPFWLVDRCRRPRGFTGLGPSRTPHGRGP